MRSARVAIAFLAVLLTACPGDTIAPRKVPGAPTIGTVTPANASATVEFTAPADAGSAPIEEYVATCTAGSSQPSANAMASPITVTGLTNGTTYGCSVKAKNSVGLSEASASVAITPFTVPAPPSIGTATAGNGQLSVAFTAGVNNGSPITGFAATCTPTGGAGITASGTTSPIVVTGLANGTTYSCTVIATNAAGPSAASASVDGTPATVPAAPTIGAATPGNGSVSVGFAAPGSNGGSSITGYTATCAVTGGVTRTATGGATATSITVTNLTNGTTYDCSVTAANAIGTSAPSGIVSVTPVGPPPAPTIGAATPGNQSASIAFTPPSSNGGSNIISYTVTCTAAASVTASGSASPIEVTGLTNGTQYSCSVRATNEAGAGTASGSVSVTPRTVPGAPTNVAATAGNGSASVSFSAPASNGGSSITGYVVTCTASGETTRTGTGPASPIGVTSLSGGVQYACSVVATNAAGNSASSASVNVTPTTPVTTAGLLCPYSYNQLNALLGISSTVSWTCNTTTRTLTGNQIPDHTPGIFPNSGNPHAISAQSDPAITFTLTPALASATTSNVHIVGWAKNGVKFDPATAETCPTKSYCTGASGSATTTYNVEALGQSLFSAGVDNSNAHVQPNGAYHYHGMPIGYMNWISSGGTSVAGTPPVQHYFIGFAVDGFPIYAKYGYSSATDATSAIREIKSSWRKRTTDELSSERLGFGTTGVFEIGTFTQDFIYDPTGTGGDLDECNGRFGKTPEFPAGIYHYYITTDFPYIQRCLKGTVPSTGRGAAGASARIGRPPLPRPPHR